MRRLTPKEQDENMSDGNEWEDDEKVSGNKKVKSMTKVRTLHEGRQLTASAGICC